MVNKSKLFKMAWGGFKTQLARGKKASFSKNLKWAWRVLKEEGAKVEELRSSFNYSGFLTIQQS